MTTSAREQSSRLADLLRREHGALADFLVALAAFDRERRWEQLGYPSLFSFLRRELRLSAGAAQYRKTAAELVQRYPAVEVALRAGDLCLSSVIELGKVITPDSVGEVLPRFFGLSSRDAAAVAVSIRPVTDPPMRELVTTVAPPAARPDGLAGALPGPVDPILESVRAPEVACPRNAPAAASAAPPPKVTPLTAELRRLNITVSRRLLEKLEVARAALSHSHPGATTDEVLEVGLDLIIERHAKRRGLVETPRRPKTPPAPAPASRTTPPTGTLDASGAVSDSARADSPVPVPPRGKRKRDHIPAHVKRAVWLRDGGRCQWKVDGGGICGSTLRVEIDHLVPVALGGRSTIENCELTCRVHNDLAARQVFGDGHMDEFTQGGRAAADRHAEGS